MPFTNKIIPITDFLEQMHKKIKAKGSTDVLIFFEVFLKDCLVAEMKRKKPDWDSRVNAGDFDTIYPLAVDILRDAASRNFSEISNTYAEANAVSIAFCEELNETFKCSDEDKYELIPIESYLKMAANAGIIKVEDGMVSLTSEGEDIAQSVEREIKGGQN